MKYFIYARKSTDDHSRQIRSIGDQLTEVREMAQREKLTVVEELIEKQSAKAPGRPVFSAMIERIKEGEAQGILAWNPDRLARNAIDGGTIIYLIDTGALKDLKFPTYKFDRSATGKFMLGISLTQSKYYSDNLGENVMRGKRQKIKNGLWPQVAPVGYVNDRRTRTIVPDPMQSPLIREMFELYATGLYSLYDLRKHFIERGLVGTRGKLLSISRIQHALTNPIYYGLMRYNGEFYEGKHQPLVTKELFDRCRLTMLEKGRAKSKGSQPFLYRGLIHCGECGGMITMERQKGHIYLRCTKKKGPCSQPFMRQEALDQQVKASLKLAAISEKTAKEILAGFDQLAAEYEHAEHERRERFRQEIAQCDDRQRRLMEVYLDNAISIDEFRSTKNALTAQRRQIQEKLEESQQQGFDRLEPLRTVVKTSLQATYTSENENPAERLKMFNSVGSNLTLRDRRLKWVPREAWQLIVDAAVVELGGPGAGSDLAGVGAQDREEQIKRRGGDSNPRYRL